MAQISACFSTTLHHHLLPSRRNILPRRISPAEMAYASDGTADLLQAAKHTVDNYVRSGMVVGLGCGRASALAIQYMGRRLREGVLESVIGVPMSISGASEAAKAGVPLEDYQDTLQTDFAFDDVDIIEEGTLTAVIGRRKLVGGESIIQEKSIVKTARSLAFIVSEKQYTRDIDGSIPVLVKSGNWMEAAEEIDDIFLGDAEVWRRPISGHAGPSGGDFPLITS